MLYTVSSFLFSSFPDVHSSFLSTYTITLNKRDCNFKISSDPLAKIAHYQAFFVKDYGTVLRGNLATTDVILLALFVYHVLFNLCMRIISEMFTISDIIQ